MRRTVLVPAMVAAALRARQMLVAVSLAALLALALTLAAPVAAQEETTSETRTVTKGKDTSGTQEQSVQGSGQEAENEAEAGDEQAAAHTIDPLQEATVVIESDDDGTVNRIEIAAVDCDIEKGATVTVEDGADNPVTFVDGDARNADEVAATIGSTPNQIVIDGFVTDSRGVFGAEGNEDGRVTDSTGVTCGRDAAAAANTETENDGDDARTADELASLSCDELLVLFRSESSSGQQYENAAGFANSDVRAKVEVCLEREIVEGTAADEDLHDTGGLSLLALAVLGVVSAAAGLSVIRGGQR